MKNLLTLKYWFTLRPEPLSSQANWLFIATVLLLILLSAIFLWLKMKPGLYRTIFKKLYNFSLGNAVIGLLFLFFNYENATFFSARFWLLAWLLLMIVWLISILKELKRIPAKKRQISQEQVYKKYLP
ncbi:MAG: hypothetical protein NTX66_01890 [Candidatus Falkowbacteria bacterium]|nr:hypothetical protein [Candidatus Falkowbacteria bacterium]